MRRSQHHPVAMFFLIRKIWFLLLLGLAAGVPFAYFQATDGAVGQKVKSWFASMGKKKDELEITPTGETAVAPSIPPERIFHYEWTPDKVMQSWPQVTRVYDGDYVGLRVALVTGTTTVDLAGALTFYFDASNQLRRISFVGTTADARPFLQLIVTRFGLTSEPTTSAGLYVARWNGQPKSALRVSLPPVTGTEPQQQQVHIALELNRPAAGYDLSREFRQVLAQDQQTGRWRPY